MKQQSISGVGLSSVIFCNSLIIIVPIELIKYVPLLSQMFHSFNYILFSMFYALHDVRMWGHW